MVKHKPPQPLPFVLRGDAKHGTIVDAKKDFVDEIPFESWGEDAKRLRDTVKYWVHAGNAYPKLIAVSEKLENLFSRQWCSGDNAAREAALAEARELLSSLGEREG